MLRAVGVHPLEVDMLRSVGVHPLEHHNAYDLTHDQLNVQRALETLAWGTISA